MEKQQQQKTAEIRINEKYKQIHLLTMESQAVTEH